MVPIKFSFKISAKPWLGLGLLLAALAFPSPLLGWFDGLPWDSRPEMLALICLLPLLGFWRLRLFGSRLLVSAALATVILKAGLGCLQSAEGLMVHVFETREKLDQGAWEKNWSSLWTSTGTAHQRGGFANAREFPMEWMNRYNQVEKLPDGSWSGDRFRREAQPWVKIEGSIWTRPGEVLVLDFGSDLSAISIGLGNTTESLKHGRKIEISAPEEGGWNQLRVLFQIDSVFSERTSFNPLVRLRDGREKSLFGLNRVTISEVRRPPLSLIFMGPWLGRTIDLLTGISLLIPVLGLFRQLPRSVLAQLIALTVLAAGGPAFVGAFGMELTGRLTFGLIPATFFAFFARDLISLARPGRTLFWILGVGAIPVLAARWWTDMAGMSFFEVGDDWLAQQNLARAIFVGGDWLSFVSEKIYVYQPGYRYFTGLLHWLFGQSAWPSRMMDAWAVVAIGSMVPALCLWAGTGNRWALTAGFLSFAAYCSQPPFRLMGQCIHEYVGTALLVGVAWTISQWPCLSKTRFLILPVLAVSAYLVRQNHIFAILACGLFFLPRMEGSLGRALGAGLRKIRQNSGGLLTLGGVVGLAVLGVCLRNWFSGGIFNINNPENLKVVSSGSDGWTTLLLILRAKPDGFSHMGWLITGATAMTSMVLFFRYGFVRRAPLEPAILMIACWLPFLSLRLYPCTERFSYYFVPFASVCLISGIAVFLNSLAIQRLGAANCWNG